MGDTGPTSQTDRADAIESLARQRGFRAESSQRRRISGEGSAKFSITYLDANAIDLVGCSTVFGDDAPPGESNVQGALSAILLSLPAAAAAPGSVDEIVARYVEDQRRSGATSGPPLGSHQR